MKQTWVRAGLLIAAARIAIAQTGGQAEIAAQGYYLRDGLQPASETTGAAIRFEEFFPGLGLLRGNLEAYSTNGGVQPADNFLQLRGAVWRGLRWNVSGGDFRQSGTLFQNPFTNLIIPEIDARGFELDAGDTDHGYSVFYGRVTVLGGPRIPFRMTVPQNLAGAALWRKFGNLQAGVRFLRFEKTATDPNTQSWFPQGRDFSSADNLTFYTTYAFNEHLQWYSEATAARATSTDGSDPGQPLSYLFGPVWQTDRLTVRANYANLGRSYFPLAGYWTGDRRGPFGEIRVRPFSRLEVFGSASRYESTAKPEDKLPILRSTNVPVGASVALPWKVHASAQVNTASFSGFDPGTGSTRTSQNRQWIATLTRPIQRHSLRVMARDMRLTMNGAPTRERSGEIEDTFHAGHFAVGGAVRLQRAVGTDFRNSIYARGSGQWTAGRFSASGFFERGKDLANQSVFATSTTNSAVATVSVRATREWNVQAEAFRTRLLSELNPDSLFMQSSASLTTNALLSRFQQWTFLFRVGKSFRWGSARPGIGMDQYTAQQIPITGTVEGTVFIATAAGRLPARDVTVRLENGSRAVTDEKGRYRFANVPEGGHAVSLDLDRLPADYNPGPATTLPAIVTARRPASADFDVYRLGGCYGKVVLAGPMTDAMENIMIRLKPGEAYTTTDKEGAFGFHNIPEGSYEAVIDAATLPAGTELKGGDTVRVVIQPGAETELPAFEIQRRNIPAKPVRKVFESVISEVSRK